MTSGYSRPVIRASEPARSTRPRPRSTGATGPSPGSGGMRVQLTLPTSPTSTSSPLDSHASLSRLLAAGGDLKTSGARFLLRQCGWPEASECRTSSLRTSGDSSRTTTGGPSKPSSERWMTAGMMRSGSVLTGNISFRRRAPGCSLSDVLEDRPPSSAFQSDAAVEKILRKIEARRGFDAVILRGRSLRPTTGSTGAR